MSSIWEVLKTATFKSEIKAKTEQMGLFKKESLDGEFSTLARSVLVSFSLRLLKFLGGGYYSM